MEQFVEFGEFLPDQYEQNSPGAVDAKGVFPAAGSYLPFPSFVNTSPAFASRALGGIFTKDDAGDSYFYVGTVNEIYETGSSNTDVSQGGGYTVASGDRWEFERFGDNILATNYTDAIQTMAVGGANFADLGGSPPDAQNIAVVRNFVVIGNIDDSVDGVVPNRVQWSGFEDATEWTPGTNQSDFQNLLGNGGKVEKIIGGEEGTIFQENSIWSMRYVGAPVIFQFNEIEKQRGTLAGGSVVQYGRSIYYLGRDGFYEMVDRASSINIGSERVNRWFFDQVDRNQLHQMSSAVDPRNSLVFWSFVSQDSTNDQPDTILIYNWVTKRFSYLKQSVEVIFNAGTLGFTLDELDPFGTLDALPFSLDSPAWQGGSVLLGGVNSSSQFGLFDGPSVDAELVTKEFGQENHSFIQSVRPDIEGDSNTTITITLQKRDTRREDLVDTAETSLDTYGRANFRSNARYHRCKVKITGGFNHAKGIWYKYQIAGRR